MFKLSGPATGTVLPRIWPLGGQSLKQQAEQALSISESSVQMLPFQSCAAMPAQTVCVPTRASATSKAARFCSAQEAALCFLALSKGRMAVSHGHSQQSLVCQLFPAQTGSEIRGTPSKALRAAGRDSSAIMKLKGMAGGTKGAQPRTY